MTKIAPAILAVAILCFGTNAFAQGGAANVAIVNIQAAIAQSNDGQNAALQLQTRFGPTREELQQQQAELRELQTQLQNQQSTLSDEARTRLLRSIDDKTKQFNRNNEDATAEFQQAEQDAITEIGRKMMGVIDEYARENGLAMILDVSSPQTPVLYADTAIDITSTVIEIYNQATAEPAASTTSTPTDAPAAVAPPAQPGSTP